jgi:CII-binding regulator of phage lambda lysogenization HflD
LAGDATKNTIDIYSNKSLHLSLGYKTFYMVFKKCSLILTCSYVLVLDKILCTGKMNDQQSDLETCKSGLIILKSNEENMDREDYQNAFDDLTNRINE